MRRVVRLPYLRLYLRRNGKDFIKLFRLIVAFMITPVFLLWCFESGLKPAVEKVALARAHYIATKTINDAIDGEIVSGGILYDDFIIFEKDTQNRITALKTNMVSVNRLRVKVVDLILKNIAEIDITEISIPLGTVISGQLLSGRGPRVPVRLLPAGKADVNFKSQFSSAGINQTRHQIFMDIALKIDIILPGHSISSEVTVELNVAETIIVGSVPESYAYFEESGETEKSQQYLHLE